jgi:hypothetical protein
MFSILLCLSQKYTGLFMNDCPIAAGAENHTNFGYASQHVTH